MNNITKDKAIEKAKREFNTIIYMCIDELREKQDMNIYTFCNVFYDKAYSRETDPLGYLRGKYIKYLEEGIISAYQRLDTKNKMRVIEWMTDITFKYVGIPEHLQKRIEIDGSATPYD